MFQQSRRRFLAGFAVLGVGGSLLGRAAMAQTATSFQCDGAVTSKAVTSLKPSIAKGGIYKDLMFGSLNGEAKDFGRYADMTFIGTLGKLAKGVTPIANGTQCKLQLRYFAKQVAGEQSFTISVDLQSLEIGTLVDGIYNSGKIEVAAFKGLNGSNILDANYDKKTITPVSSLSISASAGKLKAKLPKNGDFTTKVLIGGKVVAEVKFPKLALAKILDALDKEYMAQAVKIAADANLKGDLSNKALPAGCTVIKPSSTGTGRLCYLTTAAVGVVGLSDDCWELQQLRAFRDRFAASGGSAAAAMAEYYDHAPIVVDRINRRADAQRVWLRTYWSSIIPAAIASQIGFDALARRIYFRLVDRLKNLAAI